MQDSSDGQQGVGRCWWAAWRGCGAEAGCCGVDVRRSTDEGCDRAWPSQEEPLCMRHPQCLPVQQGSGSLAAAIMICIVW